MGKYSYLILNVVFLGSLLVFLVRKHAKIIKKNYSFLLFALLFGIIGFFIVDPAAILWGAWGYDTAKILGIYLPGGVILEELIFAGILAPLLGIVVLVLAEREEKKKPFRSF